MKMNLVRKLNYIETVADDPVLLISNEGNSYLPEPRLGLIVQSFDQVLTLNLVTLGPEVAVDFADYSNYSKAFGPVDSGNNS